MKFKYLLSSILAVFIVSSACGQMGGDKSKRESPPATVTQKVGDATIKINYSQPSMKGRKIFGGLVPYGKVWRTGANEATTFETTEDLIINGKKLPAGKYALFTIPGEDEWVVIFNSVHDQWGAYDYKQEKDVLRLKVKPEQHEEKETMTFLITEEGLVTLDWAKTRVPFMIKA